MKTHTDTNLSESADSTVKELKALLAEAEGVLAATGSEAAAGVASLRDRTKAALEKTREAAHHAMDVAKQRASEADKAIHEHPYAAIGVAAGVGLLLGALLSRGHNR
jgi:ElaB/YqjD/DUF883 family membrane-anchored ribosome-binding protein